jgi:hypothetical protein
MDDRHFGYKQNFLNYKCTAGREPQTLIVTIPYKPLLLLGGARERDENRETRKRERRDERVEAREGKRAGNRT